MPVMSDSDETTDDGEEVLPTVLEITDDGIVADVDWRHVTRIMCTVSNHTTLRPLRNRRMPNVTTIEVMGEAFPTDLFRDVEFEKLVKLVIHTVPHRRVGRMVRIHRLPHGLKSVLGRVEVVHERESRDVVHFSLGAFAHCMNLQEVVCASTSPVILTFDACAFEGCHHLQRLDLSSTCLVKLVASDLSLGSQFKNCVNLWSLSGTMHNDVVPRMCFKGCTNLKTMPFGDTWTGIAEHAFSQSGVTSVEDNVEWIDPRAFHECIGVDLSKCDKLKGFKPIFFNNIKFLFYPRHAFDKSMFETDHDTVRFSRVEISDGFALPDGVWNKRVAMFSELFMRNRPFFLALTTSSKLCGAHSASKHTLTRGRARGQDGALACSIRHEMITAP